MISAYAALISTIIHFSMLYRYHAEKERIALHNKAMNETMNETILELNGIVKTFGSSTALSGVNFNLRRGEVHALMGENGAGKSTFIKIITGVFHPDSGTIRYNGKIISPQNTTESLNMGIAAIYQHATSFPDLSVTENIFMRQEHFTKLGNYDYRKMHELARKYIEPFSSDIDVRKPMSSLSVAQQQLVEIVKALSRNARVLILDEPTASLTTHECERLYEIVDRLRKDGVSMIFITHRFEDMYRLADRITVLRDSRYIGTWDVNGIQTEDLIQAMVGRKLDQLYPVKTGKIGDEVLRVDHLSKEGYFRDISFSVRKGEVFTLTGLVGAGRTEVCQTIFGIMRPDSGKIYLDGKEIRIKSPTDALKAGIGLLPEDRLTQGFAAQLPIYKNVTAATLGKFTHRGIISEKEEIERSIDLCTRLRLKAHDISALPLSLSGGNQQKVVFAKMLNCDLKVLILDEPTKGIDVGAKTSVYEIINELAGKGYAIIMVSSEMPEVLGVSDRIAVMRSGRISEVFDIKDATQEKILAASLIEKEKNAI